MRIFSALLLVILWSGFALPAAADFPNQATGHYKLDPSHASLTFQIMHLGFSRYTGRFDKFDADLMIDAKTPNQSSLTATINPASVNTNNSELQDKLRGSFYFNVDKFPEIKFVSKAIAVTGAKTGIIKGDLTMLGVTKSVSLNITFNGAAVHPYAVVYTAGFSATATIKRSDFGMKTLIPQVADEVKIMIEAEFHKLPDAPASDAQ